MDTATGILLILTGMFVGATLAFMYMFKLLLKSEKHFDLMLNAVVAGFDRDIDPQTAMHLATTTKL